MSRNREKVWLGVSGLVVNEKGEWLVVKKSYGGLKGKWSFPAGFVDEGETVEEAVVREVFEETGIHAKIKGVIGVRSGVLKKDISDNLIIFLLKAESDKIILDEKEIDEAQFRTPESLQKDPDASLLLIELAKKQCLTPLVMKGSLNPGNHFGYQTYTLFL